MSLGIAFKGSEGIVLAADSRVTLFAQTPDQDKVIPVSFDNANKLLRVENQTYVGAVTYGLGAITQPEPRTAHSFMPEFEAELLGKRKKQLKVKGFANKLSDFFMRQWSERMPSDYSGADMIFLVGGYDKGAPYGRIFEVSIPSGPSPIEWHADGFGIIWGGQREFTERLIQGFDPRLPSVVKEFLKLNDKQEKELETHLKNNLRIRIPYQFLPLQDCVDLSIFLIRTTIDVQTKLVGVRGVGGAIDVATITRTDGFKTIQEKRIHGEGGRK